MNENFEIYGTLIKYAEIKTFRVSHDLSVRETDFLEGIVKGD